MKSFVVVGLSLAFLLVPATNVAAAAGRSSGRSTQTGPAYHWPIKPFDRQHPIRGAFGDPRTVNVDQPFGWTGPSEIGAHSFHNGIDIVGSPGTPVYPVVSGWVVRAKQDEIVVRTDDGRSFQYYHLSRARAAHGGRFVVVDRTILGWIRVRYGHVHLAEIDHGVIQNPLAPGHLEPYRDRTRPVAGELYVDDGPLPSALDGRAVGPQDKLAVAADDPQAMPVTGPWAGLPQVPALVEWRLFHGQTHTAWTVAVDFRETEPIPRDFWQVYGPGTYQNSPAFAHHLYLGTPGRFLFRLHLHLNRRRPGLYHLVVRVADVRGNQSTAVWPLLIASE